MERKIKYLKKNSLSVTERAGGKISTTPTNCLFCCACGAGSPIKFEQLVKIFETYQGFVKIIMPTGKPFSLCLFQTVEVISYPFLISINFFLSWEDATRAFDALDSKFNEIIDKILILQYSVFELPTTKSV